MKAKTQLNQDIINITTIINQEFPELSKYISEMPVIFSEKENEEINNKNLEAHYHSLVELVNNYSNTHTSTNETKNSETLNLPGYPIYPSSDDIYQNSKEETDINPEDLSKNKSSNEPAGALNEKNFEEDMSGNDLDIPGSELDDQQESVGSEDEENNYYSLGGDNHNDLEED